MLKYISKAILCFVMTECVLLVEEYFCLCMNHFLTVLCESLMNGLIDDALWCVTTLPNNSKLLTSVPSSNEINDSKLVVVFSNLWNPQNSSHLLIMSDFNVLNIDWQDCVCSHNNNCF